MTDRELLAEYLGGASSDAFTEIVCRHTNLVYNTCLRILKDVHEAEDASQVTFLVLARKASSLSNSVSLSGWLFRTAQLSSYEIRNRRQCRLKNEKEAGAMQIANKDESQVFKEDFRLHLDMAMAALPVAQRDAIVLRYFRGLSQADAAQELCCPEETLHSRVTLGLAKLRTKLQRMSNFKNLSLVALAAFLKVEASQTTPAKLARSISDVCQGNAAGSTKVLFTAQAVSHAMAWSKIGIWAIATAFVLGISSLTVLGVHHSQSAFSPATPTTATETTTDNRGVLAQKSKQPMQAPQVGAKDGQHLDDPGLWKFEGDAPLLVTASHLDVAMKTELSARNGKVIHHKIFDLSQGAVGLRISFNMTPKISKMSSVKIVAVLNQSTENHDGADTKDSLMLMYLPLRNNISTLKGGWPATVFHKHPLVADGKHTLELLVSKTDVRSSLDGIVLFQGKHGITSETVQFLAHWISVNESEDIILKLDDFSIVENAFFNEKLPMDF